MNVFNDMEDHLPTTSPSVPTKPSNVVEKPGDNFSSLSEPVLETVKRDLNSIYTKLVFFFKMRDQSDKSIHEEIRNYDLWGPFVFSLLFAFSITLHQQESMEKVFSMVIIYIIFGCLVLTLNSRLLNAKLTFLQGDLTRPQRARLLHVPPQPGGHLQHGAALRARLPPHPRHPPRRLLVRQVRLQGHGVSRARRKGLPRHLPPRALLRRTRLVRRLLLI